MKPETLNWISQLNLGAAFLIKIPVFLSILSLLGVYLSHRYSDATQLRRDLFIQISKLNRRVDDLTFELDKSRTNFFMLSQENLKLRTQVDEMKLTHTAMSIQIEDIKRKYLPRAEWAKYDYFDTTD